MLAVSSERLGVLFLTLSASLWRAVARMAAFSFVLLVLPFSLALFPTYRGSSDPADLAALNSSQYDGPDDYLHLEEWRRVEGAMVRR